MNDDYRLVRDDMWFTWDDEKAIINWKKHRITFEAASRVFLDEYAVILPDETHSDSEDREIIIGTVPYKRHSRVLFVVYVERVRNDNKKLFRIISARDASREEKKIYERDISIRLS
ncbi:MAG: BrnT family toxin [Synergistaceae bacterium]|nr:BrnT family toxin [Synergistaceae bacterium]